MAFLNKISSFAVAGVRVKTSSRGTDPRAQFVARMQDQVAALKSGVDLGMKACWSVGADGKYTLWLKQGIYLLTVDGVNEFVVDDELAAVQVFEAAIAAANDGEFDAQLNAIRARASSGIKSAMAAKKKATA
jgi:membrane carboxypeptidase/penicillin-binding protein PbpC